MNEQEQVDEGNSTAAETTVTISTEQIHQNGDADELKENEDAREAQEEDEEEETKEAETNLDS